MSVEVDLETLGLARQWRRTIHANPEIGFEVGNTASLVARELEQFGLEVVRGVGRSGVVGVLRGRFPSNRDAVGFRAELDALPMQENSTVPYHSRINGAMHACGHDGHTAMLLGAARILSVRRDFAGTIAFIFQPAEEGGAGGKAMVDDGLISRFDLKRIFAVHNLPGLPIGSFVTRVGAITALTARLDIDVTGTGGHAARPHETIDPLLIAAQIVVVLQSIVSRSVDPMETAAISITKMNAGGARNIIADKATMLGTVRCVSEKTYAMIESKIRSLAEGIAAASGASAEVRVDRGYPPTINHERETDIAIGAALDCAGRGAVIRDIPPFTFGEDFAYMLKACPGALMFLGNGDSAALHNPTYDFDDRVLPFGIGYWLHLAKHALNP